MRLITSDTTTGSGFKLMSDKSSKRKKQKRQRGEILDVCKKMLVSVCMIILLLASKSCLPSETLLFLLAFILLLRVDHDLRESGYHLFLLLCLNFIVDRHGC